MSKHKYNFAKIINRLFLFIGFGIVAHLCFLLYTTDRHTFSELNKLKPIYLVLISLCALGPWVGHTLRIMIWSKFVDSPLSFKDSLSVVVSNDVGAALTPTAVGGGPIKLAMLISKGMQSSKATFLVLLSATEDLVFYATGIILSFVFMKQNVDKIIHAMASFKWPLIFIISFIICISVALKMGWVTGVFFKKILPLKFYNFLTKLKQKFLHYLSDIKEAYVKVFKSGKIYLLVSIILLFFQWFSKFTILAVILLALGVDFTLFDVYVRQWIIWMSMLIIPTPGASGGAEAAFLLLFKNNLPGEMPNLVVSTWRFFTYYYILFLAVGIFQLVNRKSEKELVVVDENND